VSAPAGLRAPAPAGRGTAPDLVALAAVALVSAVAVLGQVPLLHVLGGLLLLVPVQGAAVTLAVAPASAGRGLLPLCGALGVVVTILEVTATDRLGLPVTALDVTVTAVVVTLAALGGAAARRARPHLDLPLPDAPAATALVAGVVVAGAVAVAAGRQIPDAADRPYSTVTFAGALERVDGVLTTAVDRPLRLPVRLGNGEGVPVTYRVSVTLDGRPVPAVAGPAVTVPAGTARELDAGAVRVADGCLHRAAVSVRSPRRGYELVLYVRGAGAACRQPSG